MAGGRATVKMRRVALSLGVVAAIGCSEEAPTGSTMAEFTADREAVAQRTAAAQTKGRTPPPSVGHGTGNRSAQAAGQQVAGTMGGVDKDFVEAYAWFSLALRIGYMDAISYRASIADKMSPDEVKEAESRARARAGKKSAAD